MRKFRFEKQKMDETVIYPTYYPTDENGEFKCAVI